MPSAEEFIDLIRRTPFVLSDEKSVQAEISRVLTDAGIAHVREVTLSPGDIVDFMLPDGIAIEVKIRAARRAIFRQCERYCRNESVNGLVLLTATALGFPDQIKGKPCWVVSMGTAWL